MLILLAMQIKQIRNGSQFIILSVKIKYNSEMDAIITFVKATIQIIPASVDTYILYIYIYGIGAYY